MADSSIEADAIAQTSDVVMVPAVLAASRESGSGSTSGACSSESSPAANARAFTFSSRTTVSTNAKCAAISRTASFDVVLAMPGSNNLRS